MEQTSNNYHKMSTVELEIAWIDWVSAIRIIFSAWIGEGDLPAFFSAMLSDPDCERNVNLVD